MRIPKLDIENLKQEIQALLTHSRTGLTGVDLEDALKYYNGPDVLSGTNHSIDELTRALGFRQVNGKWVSNVDSNTQHIQKFVSEQRVRRPRANIDFVNRQNQLQTPRNSLPVVDKQSKSKSNTTTFVLGGKRFRVQCI
jgi:hypothetical protein